MLPGRTDHATRAGPHALRLRISQRHQVVFIPARSADVLWRTVAFAGDAAWIRDIRIRLQNGLQQQSCSQSSPSRTHTRTQSHALYNVMDPCSLHIHDFALVVQVRHGLYFAADPELVQVIVLQPMTICNTRCSWASVASSRPECAARSADECRAASL